MNAQPADSATLLDVIASVGLFPPEELAEMASMLAAHFADGGGGDLWLMQETAGVATGMALVTPERMTEGAWNLLLIVVRGERRRQGLGAALLRDVEARIAARGGRLLIIDTSGTETFAGQRGFYLCCGYEQEARIRDFWRAGDDKVTYRKALAETSHSAASEGRTRLKTRSPDM